MIKVFEVVDGQAGAEQAAAIRAGLDPAKFDAELIDAAGLSKSALKKLFLERRPDVVHAHSEAGRARAAAKAAGVKKIFYTPHGYRFLSRKSAASRALGRLLEKTAARVGETVAASDAEAELARRISPRRPVHLVRDGYRGGFPEPRAHDDIVIGSTGRMTRAADPDAWVLLAQRLTDSRNGIKCVWIGGGEGEAKARTDLTNMNLLIKVSITGEQAPAAAAEALRGLDVLIRYSREDIGLDDIQRAMALGLPVVASDLPAYRELVVPGKTGFLVKSETELLERCQALIDDSELRRSLGSAGQERLREDFSPARQLAELSRLYAA